MWHTISLIATLVVILFAHGVKAQERDIVKALRYVESKDVTAFTKLINGSDFDLYSKFDERGASLAHATLYNKCHECFLALNEAGFNFDSIKSKATDDKTVLMEAAYQNNMEAVKIILENGVRNINDTTNFNVNALHFAVSTRFKRNDKDRIIIELLVNAGISLTQKSNAGATPLHMAFTRGRDDLARILIALGASLNTKSERGNSILHEVARMSETVFFDSLYYVIIENIEDIEDIDTLNNKGLSALHMAVEKRLYGLASVLINAGANINLKRADGLRSIDLAVKLNNSSMFEWLVNKGAEFNPESLLDNFRVTGTKNIYAKNRFTRTIPELDMIDTLEKYKADFTSLKGQALLKKAIVHGRPFILESLISKGAVVHKEAILDLATRNYADQDRGLDRFKKVFEILKSNNIDFNAVDENGNNAFHKLAIRRLKYIERDFGREVGRYITQTFIAHGVDIEHTNNLGMTPLVLHLKNSVTNKQRTHYIFEEHLQDINLNKLSDDGKSLLMMAYENGYFEFAEKLIENSINVYLKDKQGRTAIHYIFISMSKYSESFTKSNKVQLKKQLDYLISMGFNLNQKDNTGKTAISFVKNKNKLVILEVNQEPGT